MAKKTIKSNPKVKKAKTDKTEQKSKSLQPIKKSFPQILKSIFFPSKEDYTPQKQLKEIQWGLYFLAFTNLLLGFVSNLYIVIDAIILGLIAYNLNKNNKKYVVSMLILYTFTTIIVNILAKEGPLNLINIVLIIFCIQTSRLVFFEKKI